MKTPSDTTPVEPNATAWAMGELSAAEVAAFEAGMKSDPVAAREASETRDFCQLLGSAMAPPAGEVAINRERLIEASKKAGRPSGKVILFRLAGLAACVTAAAYAWQAFGGAGKDSVQADIAGESRPAAYAAAARREAAASPAISNHAPAEPAAVPTDKESRNNLVTVTESDFKPDDTARATEAAKFLEVATAKADTSAAASTALPPAAAVPAPAMKPMKGKTVSDYAAAAGGMRGDVRRRMVLPSGESGDPLRDLDSGVNSDALMGREMAKVTTSETSEEGWNSLTKGESYAGKKVNPYQLVGDAPLSTFSIDVDTAAYSNVRRMLNMGQRPPTQAVRLEEMVNYFPYDYAPPVDGKPFAVQVEMTQAPWQPEHRLARIAIKGKEVPQSERPAANLVFLVDVSGSMSDANKLPLVKQSLRFIVSRLTEKDRVSLVTYAGSSGVVLPSTAGNEQQRIMAAIEGLGPGGSTNGAGGITSAYAQAGQHFVAGGVNRVVLATDGDFNVGVTSHGDLEELITAKAKTGVFLSVLGYGMGNLKDDTMELLADKGNGNYAYIDSLSEARKALDEQFSGTLITIAKDVKIQVEFNPAQVRAYRLLGYENRMLAKEDFTDDKKDAGEIGAGHTVTALYEIIPANAALPVNTEPLKYQPVPAAVPAAAPVAAAPVSAEALTVKLRWKAPDAATSEPMSVAVVDEGKPLSEASPSTQWAVAVAGFAELLRGNDKGSLTWAAVRKLARDSKGPDANGYRGEFLQLIDKAESLTGK